MLWGEHIQADTTVMLVSATETTVVRPIQASKKASDLLVSVEKEPFLGPQSIPLQQLSGGALAFGHLSLCYAILYTCRSGKTHTCSSGLNTMKTENYRPWKLARKTLV